MESGFPISSFRAILPTRLKIRFVIGRLAGGVAHDFNKVIGAIMGWADIGVRAAENGLRVKLDRKN